MLAARRGRMTWQRRVFARVLSHDLTTFVVPGLEVAHAAGLDLEAAGLTPVATPRHAVVLLLVGEVPEELARAAAVVYGQMPRPRTMLAIGADQSPLLPPAAVEAVTTQEDLVAAVRRLRTVLAQDSWPAETSASAVEPQPEPRADAEQHAERPGGYQPPSGNGSMESQDDHQMRHDHAHLPASEAVQTPPTAAEHDASHHGMDHSSHGSAEQPGGGHEHMQHGDGGFMSMAMMTQDLPRSPDGLPMEWLTVPFGPLFPGLPAGLAITFTLDGDTVVQTSMAHGTMDRDRTRAWPGPISAFPARFARLDPLATDAYRVLAIRALDAAGGVPDDRSLACDRIGALERQRALSHLVWLASFSWLIGDRWLRARAISLHQRLRTAPDVTAIARLRPEIARFVDRALANLPLRRRLTGVGSFEEADTAPLLGPVARAAGREEDARQDDQLYRDLGFTPIVGAGAGADAWSCLTVRLAEIRQSLDLIGAAGVLSGADPTVPPTLTGIGMATVETPRGRATLRLTISGGVVQAVDLDAPSPHNLALLQPVTAGGEVSDALAGVAALDISPWELGR